MRAALFLAIALVVGCGPKKPPTAAAEETTATESAEAAPAEAPAEEEPVVVEEPMPEPEPMEPPPPEPNADFQAVLTKADGSVTRGHVIRVDRGDDWYAERGWVDAEAKLKVTLEGDGTEIEVGWTEIDALTIEHGGRGDINCQYDSGQRPWVYMCVLPSTSKVKTTDGRAWKAATRHLWRFTFEDGTEEEFYLYKLPVRDSDPTVEGLEMSENPAMYGQLQDAAVAAAKVAVTRIEINP